MLETAHRCFDTVVTQEKGYGIDGHTADTDEVVFSHCSSVADYFVRSELGTRA
jgi:hypothetical protein